MDLTELHARLSAVAEAGSRSAGLVMKDAEAAKILRVLEYGSVAGQRPWPHPGEKTTLATDPETGAQVVVSAAAPQGFIRVRVGQIAQEMREAVARQSGWLDAAQTEAHLARAVALSARGARTLICEGVATLSPELAEKIEVAAE